MTKEEYHQLLQSDYWKGYSYAIIKERNFTCADCGRQFPGKRNKLNVHHLHYREADPWSYNPDELIVLCRECHARRHGVEQLPTDNHSLTKSLSNLNSERNVISHTYPAEHSNRQKKKTKLKLNLIVLCLIGILLGTAAIIERFNVTNKETMEQTKDIRKIEKNEKKSNKKTNIVKPENIEDSTQTTTDETLSEYTITDETDTVVNKDANDNNPEINEETKTESKNLSLKEKIAQKIMNNKVEKKDGLTFESKRIEEIKINH